jgi:transporter family-2 protein
MGILIAVISGALMSIQGVFNEGVTKQTSMWVSASFVQLTAFLFCVAAWFFTGRDSSFSALFSINNKYMLLGGIMGALITYTVVRSMSSLGPAQAVIIIVTAQVLVAYLIELFGLFGVEKSDFQWSKLIGILLTISGIVLFKK